MHNRHSTGESHHHSMAASASEKKKVQTEAVHGLLQSAMRKVGGRTPRSIHRPSRSQSGNTIDPIINKDLISTYSVVQILLPVTFFLIPRNIPSDSPVGLSHLSCRRFYEGAQN
jgi:hypothetical protein